MICTTTDLLKVDTSMRSNFLPIWVRSTALVLYDAYIWLQKIVYFKASLHKIQQHSAVQSSNIQKGVFLF